MRIAIACGGTGGHVLPGIVAGRRLRERGRDVTLWLSGRVTESWVMQEWGGQTQFVAASGLPARFSARALGGAAAMLRAIAVCRSRMRTAPPDVLLAMGGYASVGPAVAARLLRVPLVLHEANAVPGRAIAFLSRMARLTALGFPEAAAGVAGRSVVTGFPLRPLQPGTFEGWGNPDERFTILVMGGSQGAHALNMLCCEAMTRLHALPLRVIHLAGKADEAEIRRRYEQAGIPALVFAFLTEMGRAYGSADFAICRSGAASCAELEAMRVPALLVPLPGAPRDHQTANARSACAGGGMEMRAQRDATAEWLEAYIASLLRDPSKPAEMKRRLAERPVQDAAGNLADVVEAVGGGRTIQED